MTFELGSTVGGYQFIDILDSNREGTSYKVRNVLEQRFEVLRVLSEATQSDKLRFERFQREAKILARLNHPHIVSFCDSKILFGRFVIATEWVEGTNLAERLEIGAIPIPDSIRYIWQALEALECAHKEGVVHRDIQPSKLILTADSELKLDGFTLARSTADPRLTQVGATVGSAHYMSPEQVQATGELDGRSDLYSLGVVLYELAAHRKPFQGSSQFDVMLAQVETIPVRPSLFNPAIPDELDQLVLRALEKDPADRFQSASEFREALMSVTLTASPEPETNIEDALEKLRYRKQETSRRQEQRLAQHEDLIVASLPQSTPMAFGNMSPFARKFVVASITLAAVALFFILGAQR